MLILTLSVFIRDLKRVILHCEVAKFQMCHNRILEYVILHFEVSNEQLQYLISLYSLFAINRYAIFSSRTSRLASHFSGLRRMPCSQLSLVTTIGSYLSTMLPSHLSLSLL
jgi:hypothetical protein